MTNFSHHWQDTRQLVTLMLPILVTQICQASLGLIDTIMAGRVSALDLSGVSIGAGIWLPLLLLAIGTLIATTPLLGEAIGQQRFDKIPFITQQSLWLATIIGVFGVLLVNQTHYVFDLLKVPNNIQPIAKEYLFGISLGFPAVTLYTTLRSYAESLQQPLPVTIISVIGVILDIPLNYMFIHGFSFSEYLAIPAMGGAGCGYASGVVLWLNFIFLSSYLMFSKKSVFANHRFFINFSLPNYQSILKVIMVGLPIGIAIFFEASLFSLASLIISPLGEIAVASHQVAMSITSQLFMLPMSIAMALTIMVSNRFGAKDWQGLRRIKMLGLTLASSIAFISMIGIALFRDILPSFFTENILVASQASVLLWFAMLYQVFDAWQVTIAGILRGIQDTTIPMWLTLFCYWIVALPLGTYFVRFTDMGNQGFWIALVIGLGLASLLLGLRLLHQQTLLKQQWQI